jgi:hypothetical protein
MGVNDSIRSLANRTITVLRRNAGAYDAGGHWVPSSTTQTIGPLRVVEQPAENIPGVLHAAELLTDEQGEKVYDVRIIWTTTELFVRDARANVDPDIVTFDGSNWKVFRKKPWALGNQKHWMVAVTRLTQGAS